jgi:hypothetical protein
MLFFATFADSFPYFAVKSFSCLIAGCHSFEAHPMKYLDDACAWTILLTAVIFLLVIELWRPSGIGFDTPLFWIPVAMINFLRLRNGYRSFLGLRTFAILANLMVLLLEIIRLGEWGVWVLRNWSLCYIIATLWVWTPYLIISIAALGELMFSIFPQDTSREPVSA